MRIRAQLDREGYVLRKSGTKYTTLDDMGGYMVYDASNNLPVFGRNWDLDLDEVEAWMQP